MLKTQTKFDLRRLVFVPLVTNKKAQADRRIEFVPFASEEAKEISAKYQQLLLKDSRETKVPT